MRPAPGRKTMPRQFSRIYRHLCSAGFQPGVEPASRDDRSTPTSLHTAENRWRPRAQLGVHRRRSGREQLPQNELKNAAIRVILRFLRSVDPNQCLELFGLTARTGAHAYLTSRSEAANQIANASNLEHFLAGQS